jgi:hypothetical protein
MILQCCISTYEHVKPTCEALIVRELFVNSTKGLGVLPRPTLRAHSAPRRPREEYNENLEGWLRTKDQRLSADGINVFKTELWLKREACLILEDIANNTDIGIDERVLAWAKLKAWGHGREFACCHVRDLRAPRARAIVYPGWAITPEQEKEHIVAIKDELVVASQQQCAFDLDIPVQRVHAAVSRLVKRGILTTQWVESRSLSTKHKLGKGFRAYLVNKWVLALCPGIPVSP